jgi:hypothetical protein
VDTLAEVVANYSSAGLPLETLWSDIEYMPKRFWTMEMDECEFVLLFSLVFANVPYKVLFCGGGVGECVWRQQGKQRGSCGCCSRR